MPNEKPTQQEQRAATGHNPTSEAQPLAPTDHAHPETRDPTDGATSKAQNWLIVIFTGVIAIATIVYSYFGYGQWTSMDKALTETQKNRELEYRAYISAKGALFQPRKDNPAWADIILITGNTGRTPVRDAKMKRVLEHRDAPPPEETIINEATHPGSKILYVPLIDYTTSCGAVTTRVADILANPQSTPSIQPTPMPNVPSLTPPEILRFGDGWYLYGIIEYKDIFDKPHWTKFCFYLAAPGGSIFAQCPTFNDAN
jgi:hypothetical protein